MVSLTINGKKVRGKEGSTLLELCRERSISIPTLCYHPDLSPHGSCRLCTVEVLKDGKRRMVTACNFPVQTGIEVWTHSESVLRVRRLLVELLLARCPEAKLLKELAEELGVEKSRFDTKDAKEKCLLCGLCIRTCREIVGANAIGFSQRGTLRKVSPPFEVDSDQCIACGACEFICPTGAIRMEMDRIRKIKDSGTGTRRYCRYMRLGLIDFMICSNGYECWRCELDQRMEDRFGTHPAFALKPAKRGIPFQIGFFTFHPNLFYHEQHLWLKPMDSWIKVGLDSLSSSLALVADSLWLPLEGESIKEGERIATLIQGDKEVTFLSPLTGRILAVNREVLDSPSLVGRDPYHRGWLLLIQPEEKEKIWEFYSGERAREWFTKKAQEMEQLLEDSKRVRSPKEVFGKEEIREKWDRWIEILLTHPS
jgi:bidirectional [NiFe] hydrogenase diaphorase subunit